MVRSRMDKMQAICTTNKHSDEAWFLWKWRYPNYYHNGPVYATMISILGTLGRLNEMRDVIEQMKEDSCECKDSVFVSVIKTYANVGLVDEADKVIGLDGIRMLDQNTSRTLRIYPLENITKCDRRYLEASQLLEKMSIKSYWPCTNSYNSLIRGLCFLGRQYETVMWLEDMISQRKLPEISVWNSLASLFCNSEKIKVSSETFSRLRSFAREHIGAKTEYDFGRVRVYGKRSLENNRRARFNALYQSNPVLEAFGNVKTVRNDNSREANILVDPNGEIKLTDFGMAKHGKKREWSASKVKEVTTNPE
ncbi:hypothetical protein JHK86_031739 [Glycine max]|nr:hypothetical protein JHK86_031739 [Glycine max]